ncbi:MAG: hypothetical protein M1814_004920 [Vezdaea aestivalis]|nr:MAG: hypothetical protein M1814_004920 [Vezdaea aestivalis]
MSIMTKRQQARNERALQDLVKIVPGNDKCADCQAWNPGWASWSLGIFLCMRCASLHRKLGTHISKVKSLSMDSWSNDQVDHMRKNGNVISNKLFNPQNVKPPIPLDIDEADSTMERFLRQKYDSKTLQGKELRAPVVHSTGSSSSEEPPPLPPKPAFRTGLSSRGSSAQSTPQLPPHSPRTDSKPTSPPSSFQFDNVSGPTGESVESKLARLKDMGFKDIRKNATILRAQNNNLERTVESLARLYGDPPARAKTPLSANFDGSKPLPQPNNQLSKGLPTPDIEISKSTSTPSSHNPFDRSYNQPQQLSQTMDFGGQSSASLQNPNLQPSQSAAASTNPFNSFGSGQAISNPSLQQSMSALTVSQPLFPHATGGLPHQQPVPVLYPPLLTPPLPGANSHFAPFTAAVYGTQNPFLSHMAPVSQSQQPLPDHKSNSFQTNQPSISQSFAVQNPSPMPSHPYQQHYFAQPFQPLPSAAPVRADKSAILALYNHPHLAPPPLPQAPENSTPDSGPSNVLTTAIVPSAPPAMQSRSASMPVTPAAGSRNPFAAPPRAAGASAVPLGSSRHLSQESVDVNLFATGRTSPDAFANLSARFVR